MMAELFCQTQKLGGIDFLYHDILKVPTKLSKFHQQALLYWSLLYKPSSQHIIHSSETKDTLVLTENHSFWIPGSKKHHGP